MRLWHEDMIQFLPTPQLLGQHRECCALRGNGWGRKHSTVNYVFDYSPYKLFQYHQLIMDEMKRRNYKVTTDWLDGHYRGMKCEPYEKLDTVPLSSPIYPEHDDRYLQECVDNLAEKGIFFNGLL
ncbi:hypothetical protein GIY11_04165 [Aerococcaceae bacterium DSM 109653]|uniref:Pyrimidine dimer DNA glycosylase n=1 Tax=Fundicoccus ignavus TaxID=2664442 RepID=A0A844BXK5_9LACT|nr:TIGR02328 family protein [Fundicoccus ignavus]MRI81206.1 hypothetical protein [Fundicoccus ignavus]